MCRCVDAVPSHTKTRISSHEQTRIHRLRGQQNPNNLVDYLSSKHCKNQDYTGSVSLLWDLIVPRNRWGWKGTLDSISSHLLLRSGLTSASCCSGPFPGELWTSPGMGSHHRSGALVDLSPISPHFFPFNLARISPVAACPHFLSYFFSPSGKRLGSTFSITIHQEPKDCVLLPAFILLCLRLLSPSRLRGSLDVLSLTSLRPVCHTALPCPGKLCTGHRTPDVHTTDG